MITLQLTPEQAATLWDILQNIGGNPEGTRGHADAVGKKLFDQWHLFRGSSVNLTKVEGWRSIYFKP